MKKLIFGVIIAGMLSASNAQAFPTTYNFFMNNWSGGTTPEPEPEPEVEPPPPEPEPAVGVQRVLQGGGLGDQETSMGGMW